MPGTIADLPIERFERLERAILGDPDVGHLGAIERLNQVDRAHDQIPEIHRQIEDRRVAGDRRLHERLDDHIEATNQRIENYEAAAAAHRNKIEKKIDRFLWAALGSGLAGFITGWGISGFPLP